MDNSAKCTFKNLFISLNFKCEADRMHVTLTKKY